MRRKESPVSEALPGLEQHLALLLGSLSASQQKGVIEFASCAVFCDDPAVRKLLAYMVKQRNKRPEKGFLMQRLYLESYNRKIVEPEKMATLLNSSITLLEDFIATTALKVDRMKRAEYLTMHVAELPETTVFRAALSQWEKAIEEAPESYEKLYQKGRILQEEWAHWATDRYKKAPRLINRIVQAHEDYYLTVQRLFEHAGEMRAHLFNDQSPDTKSAQPPNLLLSLSNQLIALHQEPSEAAYLAFWDTYTGCFKHLGNVEREWIFRSLLNYCTVQMKSGNAAFIRYAFQLCNWATRKKGFTARWLRSDADFLNIALAFCRPDALQEMHDFIHTHSDNLPEDLRREALALALAYYHFFKGEFSESRKYLEEVVSWKIQYKLRYHTLRIRLYYEIGKLKKDFEDLETALESYDKYFDRDEWLYDKRRDNYIRLAWFVRKIMGAVSSTQSNALADAAQALHSALEDPGKALPIAREWIESEISKWRSNA